ncbi:MAG TPA: hypothetical protein QGH10_17495, partial [Armatimonadota bacterium]|nr:hypothetical protein [Armatimonadota bacterium]
PLDMGVRVTSARGDVRFGTCTEGPGFGSSVIDQVDYARDRVALAWSREAEADFVPGAALRIYNAGRSAVFHVTASERNDDKLWLTLTETALFARGRVVDVGDGQLMVEAYLTFADGTLEHNTFDGAWLGDERSTELVRGASHQDRRNIIYLAEPVPAAALRERYLGQMASVWQYGPGDRVETARVSTTR